MLAMGMMSSVAHAAVKFESELCRVSINLPDDRWTVNRVKENARRGRVKVFIRDWQRLANFEMRAEARRDHPQYATIDEWVERRMAPRRLEKYGKDDYTVELQERGEAMLGSGQRVRVVKYSLIIEDRLYRNVRIAYFPNRDGTHWHFVFVYNTLRDSNLDSPFQKIMKGFTLRD